MRFLGSTFFAVFLFLVFHEQNRQFTSQAASGDSSCPSVYVTGRYDGWEADNKNERVPALENGMFYAYTANDGAGESIALYMICQNGVWETSTVRPNEPPPTDTSTDTSTDKVVDDSNGTTARDESLTPEQLAYLQYLKNLRELGKPAPDPAGSAVQSFSLGQTDLGSADSTSPIVGFSNAYTICERVKRSGSLGSSKDCSIGDEAFMNKGVANKVVQAFEIDTGMPRSEALEIFNTIAKEKSTAGQSQLDAALKTAKAMLAAVPNQGFRDRAETALENVTDSDRTKVEEEINAKLDRIPASTGESAPTALGDSSKSPIPSFSGFPGAQSVEHSQPGRPSSASRRITVERDLSQKRELEQLEGMLLAHKETTFSAAQLAREEAVKDLTLFARVKAKYRTKLKLFRNPIFRRHQ